MKKVLLSMFAIILSFSCNAFAHPAKSLDVSVFDKVITVNALHPVMNAKKHYIYMITVSLNGDQIISQKLFAQIGNEQRVKYTIPSLKKGDVVEVKTECNKGGTNTEKITVE